MALKSEFQAGSGPADSAESMSAEAAHVGQQLPDELQALVVQQAEQLEMLEAERNSLLTISTSLQDEVRELRHALMRASSDAAAVDDDIVIEAPSSGYAGSAGGQGGKAGSSGESAVDVQGNEGVYAELRETVELLRAQLQERGAESDARITALQKSLEQENQRLAVLQAESATRDAQLENSRVESSQKDLDIGILREELESARQQIADLQQLVEKGDVRVKNIEVEHQDSTRKSHEELKRKNDIEKEMQGQIDRLRKQLEQTSRDYQKSRASAQEDLDNLRDELHAERQARAEERAQMAARQRELKEQLAAVATEHEVNFSKQSDVIEEAVDAVRAEERSRLQAVLDAHAATEEQLVKVQQELQQAHAETVVFRHQERERQQADIKLMEEQYRQAETAIKQLESQLRGLTRERDNALDEQSSLYEKIDTLRGELEVTRGLMNVAGPGQVEDPGRLRKQLDEARRNVEIAVRLRAEAEAARDRLLNERDALLHQLEGSSGTNAPLYIPSLDTATVEPATKHAAKTGRDQEKRTFDRRDEAIIANGNESGGRIRRSPGWLGGLAGTVLAAVIVAAGWWLVGGSRTAEDAAPMLVTGEQSGDPAVSTEATDPPETDHSHMAAAPTGEPAQVSPLPVIPAPRQGSAGPGVAVNTGEKRATMSGTESSSPVRSVVASGAPAADAGVASQQPKAVDALPRTARAARQAVLRAFNDTLKGGGAGPEMVELAVAGYFMGSYGNSLNFEEGPRHLVKLPGFSIGKYEVTFDEYDRFARATGRRLPYDESWGRGERPVINVSWHDAQDYVDWLSDQTGHTYRLPSEAEWEYAARGGSYWMYWWMAAEDAEATDGVWANCHNCGSEWDGVRTAPVGQFPANTYGLYDMAGNVQEWIADCYHESYDGAPQDGSVWLRPHCTQRVVRGGGYTSPLDTLRSAKRGQLDQDTRLDNLGFRVVREN